MFSRRQNESLGRRFQLVYILQLCAVVAIFIGMFLIWWEGVDRLTALDLLGRTTGDIERRNPQILGQPLIVLWLLAVVAAELHRHTGGAGELPVAGDDRVAGGHGRRCALLHQLWR